VHEGQDPALAKKAARAKASESAADTVKALCENYFKREGSKPVAFQQQGERLRLS
jgi:hypothetical protein